MKKKMKKKILALILAMTMTFALAACGGSSTSTDTSTSDSAASEDSADETEAEESSSASSDAEYNLTFSLQVSKGNFQADAWEEWADAITEATDGRVTFTFYYDDTLLDASSAYSQLVSGVADLADCHRYVNDGFVIGETWKSLTSGIPEEAYVEFSYRLFEEFPEIAAEYDDVKWVAMTYNAGPTYQILTVDKEVSSPEDMEGLTIWCEADWNAFVEACGATPVNTPFSEVYSSLQKNMYDGLMIASETLQSCNFAEVCQYCTKLNLSFCSNAGHLMNLDTWNSLPEDIQEIFDSEEMRSMIEDANYAGYLNSESTAMDWAVENYGTVEVTLSDDERDAFMERLLESNLEQAKDLDAQGLPGTEIVETLAEWTEEWEQG